MAQRGASPAATDSNSLPGGHSEWEPPDPIPNSEVKTLCADGSVPFGHARVGHCQASNATPVGKPTGVSLFDWPKLPLARKRPVAASCPAYCPEKESTLLRLRASHLLAGRFAIGWARPCRVRILGHYGYGPPARPENGSSYTTTSPRADFQSASRRSTDQPDSLPVMSPQRCAGSRVALRPVAPLVTSVTNCRNGHSGCQF